MKDGLGPLVTPEWLAQRLNDPRLRVVDIRGKVLPVGSARADDEGDAPRPRYLPKREEYDAGHIPGAVFVDWTRDIVDLDDPVPVQIAKPDVFAAKMGELGIGDDTRVVAYDDYDHAFAGRLAWALRYYGHDGVHVLDGGWKAWAADGRATTRDVPTPPSARFTPRARLELRRTADQVAASTARGALLIDARSAEQYEGRASAASRAGHIPGARNVPYAHLVDPATGAFLPREAIARVFAVAGIDVAALPREIVVYCNGGVTCNVPRTALALFGRDDVAVYDGSWNEWGNDPARPLATGRDL
jgi:thiosulfate/3-mercaptopyruvate sulfurtransferase